MLANAIVVMKSIGRALVKQQNHTDDSVEVKHHVLPRAVERAISVARLPQAADDSRQLWQPQAMPLFL
jgi:hypothetical protein